MHVLQSIACAGTKLVAVALCAHGADIHLQNLAAGVLTNPAFPDSASEVQLNDTMFQTQLVTSGLSILTEQVPEVTEWQAGLGAGFSCLPSLQVLLLPRSLCRSLCR